MLAFACTHASIKKEETPVWQDQGVWQINKEKARAYFIPFQSVESINDDIFSSSLMQSLNGEWNFNLVLKPADRPLDFYKDNYDITSWDKL